MEVFELSTEGHSENLDLFQGPESKTAVISIDYEEHRPSGQLSIGSPIDFYIAPTAIDYIDIKKTRLNLKVKITKANGDAVGTEDSVGLVNLPLHQAIDQYRTHGAMLITTGDSI